MDRIIYVISSALDYKKLICNDAGPEYANAMGWSTLQLNEKMEFDKNEIYVIDNRISATECLSLGKIIDRNPKIHFVLKIVDPYIEHLDNYYYQWVMNMVIAPNVQLFTVYEPKEFTKVVANFTKNPIIYVPYAYDKNKEIDLEKLKDRKNQVIISGAVNSQYYPKRAIIWQKSRHSLSRPFYPTLNHPGYLEMTNILPSHQFIGSSYVDYLSKYKYMLLCGSRCRIELLKFHECAYAGCLPIGEAPTALADIAVVFKFPDVFNLTKSTIKLIRAWTNDNHLRQINIYRNYLQENRNQEKLNNSFLKQLTL